MSTHGRAPLPRLLEDPVTGELVLCAPGRSLRPRRNRAEWPADDRPCDFCEGSEARTTPEVLAFRADGSAPDGPGWRVRVVPNLYPAVAHEDVPGAVAGVHEVLIEGAAHSRHPAELGAGLMHDVFRAASARLAAISRAPGVRSVFLFKNVGPQAGASMEHNHWQILGLPFEPPRILREAEGAARFHRERGACVFCRVLADARGAGTLVLESGRFAAICPPAPKFPLETWIVPVAHETVFPRASEVLAELAQAYAGVMQRLAAALDVPPLNVHLHHGPAAGVHEALHWHLEVIPRHVGRASLELGAELPINSVPPAEAAARLRAAAL